MGVPQKAVAYIKPEEYLALEEKATTRHEYLDGVIYAWQGFVPEAMAGGSREHAERCQNILIALRQRLRGSGCAVYMSEVRLRIERANAYFYPDIMVTCSERDMAGADPVHVYEPSVVVEVLSDSTEAFDRGEKFAAYRQLDSLQSYVLVSSRGRRIEVFERGPGNQWAHTELSGEILDLPALKISLPVAEFFDVNA